jgi:hypothetical protein
MPEIAEQIFDLPIRRGSPAGWAGWPITSQSGVRDGGGLVLYAQRNHVSEAGRWSARERSAAWPEGSRGLFKEFSERMSHNSRGGMMAEHRDTPLR